MVLFPAGAKVWPKKSAPAAEPEWTAMSRGEYIAALSLTPKTKPAVRAYMKKEIKRLSASGYAVATMRDSLVARIEIPASQLFAANDSTVSETGKKKLRALLPSRPTDYRVWVSVHTSDVGSADYLERFSQARAQSVADALSKKVQTVVSHGIADREPIAKNDSYIGREANRRVEICLIPSDALVERLNVKK